MSRIFNEKVILLSLILTQPLLDIYFLYDPTLVAKIGFSPATIIRIIFVVLLFIYFYKDRLLDKTLMKYSSIYLVLLGLYSGLHLYLDANYTMLKGNGTFGYTVVGEIFYIVRLAMPIFILLVSSKIKLKSSVFERVIRILTLAFSGTIVLSNLLKISLTSYGNGYIRGNIFDWFSVNNSLGFYELSSKGFFYFANATSALLFMLLPIIGYYTLKHFCWTNVAILWIHFFAMLMLGTRTGLYGLLIGLVMLLITYLFFTLIKKDYVFSENKVLLLVMMIIAFVGIFRYTPSMRRTGTTEATISIRQKEEQKKREDDVDTAGKKRKSLVILEKQLDASLSDTRSSSAREQLILRFLRKNIDRYSFTSTFFQKSYPYQNDPEFWYKLTKWPITERMDNRKVEVAMIRRVSDLNGNKTEPFFGMGYTRMSSIYNIEQDFLSHYYSIGLMGVALLLAPYILILLYVIVKMLTNFAQLFTMQNVLITFGLSCLLLISAYSGNVMDFLTQTILLAFIEGQLVRNIRRTNNSEKSRRNMQNS